MGNDEAIKRRKDICESCANFIDIKRDLLSIKGERVRAHIVYCKTEVMKRDLKYNNIRDFLKKNIAEDCLRKFECWILEKNKGKENENITSV